MFRRKIFEDQKFIILSGLSVGIITGVGISVGYAVVAKFFASEKYQNFSGMFFGLIVSAALFLVIMLVYATIIKHINYKSIKNIKIEKRNTVDIIFSSICINLSSMLVVFFSKTVNQFSIKTAIAIFVVNLFYTGFAIALSKSLTRK